MESLNIALLLITALWVFIGASKGLFATLPDEGRPKSKPIHYVVYGVLLVIYGFSMVRFSINPEAELIGIFLLPLMAAGGLWIIAFMIVLLIDGFKEEQRIRRLEKNVSSSAPKEPILDLNKKETPVESPTELARRKAMDAFNEFMKMGGNNG